MNDINQGSEIVKIIDYSLVVKSRVLLEDVNVEFFKGSINHIVGKNGVGKSMFAKDLILNKNLHPNLSKSITLISSASNVPYDITKKDLIKILTNTFSRSENMIELMDMLHIDSIPNNTLIKNLSDGQKQKLKILSFLLEDKPIVILDEITNALDKRTINEIHTFLNEYISINPEKVIINITHNLADLKALEGHYFMLDNQEILNYKDQNELICDYIDN